MGAHLTRLEIKAYVKVFLQRLSDFRVEDVAEINYLSGAIIGPRKCHWCGDESKICARDVWDEKWPELRKQRHSALY